MFYFRFSPIGKFWSCCCLSFDWLSLKLKKGCPSSSYSLRLLLCGLVWCLRPFERCSSYHCKSVLKVAKLAMLIKNKRVLLPRNVTLTTFGETLVVILTKVNQLYLRSLMVPSVLYCICLLKTFLSTLLDNSGISLPAFSSRTKLKPQYICNSQVSQKGHNQLWLIKGIWSWLYPSGDSKKQWVWTFKHIGSTLHYVSWSNLVSQIVRRSLRSLYLRMLERGQNTFLVFLLLIKSLKYF